MTSRKMLAFVAAGALLAGCGRKAALAPPEVHWGQDVCAVCTMIVSEERPSAAAAVDVGNGRIETRVYDDIGCLLRDRGVETFAARWVHDQEDGNWIPADTACFVLSSRLRTPMGSGVAAFASRERARSFAAGEDAPIADWSGLLHRDKEAGIVPPPPPAQEH